ncbi:MAG: HAMP domain-containing sensor histidine kinase [Actinomycetota bacterium]
MSRLRLRTIVLVPLVLALVVGAAVVGVVIHERVEADQIASVDTEIDRALRPLAVSQLLQRRPEPDGDGDGEPPPGAPGADGAPDAEDDPATDGPQQVTIGQSGTVLRVSAGSEELAGRDLSALLTTDLATIDGDPRLRALAIRQDDGRIEVVALSLASVDDSLASLRRNLIVGIGALVLVQALIAAALVRWVNRPLTRLRDAAHRIAEGDLDTPIDTRTGSREIADLGGDLDRMVSRRTSTIDERERAAAEALEARATTERFMADVSHELRTPLTAIKGYADLHAGGMLDADGVDTAMSRIGGESARLVQLVRELLELLAPTDVRHLGPVDVAAVASAVAQDLRAAHPDHPITLDLTEGCVVEADAARLHQAVLNLGANACQHTPAGTPVLLRVAEDGDRVRLAVVDRGPGMEPEVAATVLAPFVRGDAARSRASHDGSGLGLAITDRIARQHHGEVEVQSALGVGTTVILTLPSAPG